MSDARDVEICRLQEEVRCLRGELERVRGDNLMREVDGKIERLPGYSQNAEVERLRSELKAAQEEIERLRPRVQK